MAYGFPVEQERPASRRLIDVMERQVPTCHLTDSAAQAKQRAAAFGLNLCPVVNEQGVVLGVVTADRWTRDPGAPAEKIMEPGPTTLRPSASVNQATELLDKQDAEAVLVTSSDGILMGVFRRRKTPGEEQLPKTEIWA
ncbi:MAG TPA: CBS domain-containing protein [Candidatus Binatia bacterium]|nr:CBS domain-containing protein [Candidatus Binatia bacterium]